jgi:hypothetical protein
VAEAAAAKVEREAEAETRAAAKAAAAIADQEEAAAVRAEAEVVAPLEAEGASEPSTEVTWESSTETVVVVDAEDETHHERSPMKDAAPAEAASSPVGTHSPLRVCPIRTRCTDADELPSLRVREGETDA